jgi:hypothetical protein
MSNAKRVAESSPAPLAVFGSTPEVAPELPAELPAAAAAEVAPELPADELPAAPTIGLTIGAAVAALKAGRRVTRSGWNGRGMWLSLFTPDRDSDMTVPYVFMSTAAGELVPWLCSQSDLLAEDWTVVD